MSAPLMCQILVVSTRMPAVCFGSVWYKSSVNAGADETPALNLPFVPTAPPGVLSVGTGWPRVIVVCNVVVCNVVEVKLLEVTF